jgi:LacI family transcriptional regulator
VRVIYMKKKATTIDVARKAGVSQTTVSRVLNGYSHIKEETREAVLKAIEELEFSPNEIARSMVKQKTRTIGVILGDISNPFYAEAANIIITNAREKNYDVFISDTDYCYDAFDKNIRTMIGNRVDGVLIAAIYKKESSINELFKYKIPVMFFNVLPHGKEHNYIIANNKRGSDLAVKHLKDLGHTKISMLSYPSKYPSYYLRYQGFLESMKKYMLPIDEDVLFKGGYIYEEIYPFVKEALKRSDAPTCFITTTDQQAIAVMDSVKKLGFNVPKDISIVGFGNIELSSHPYFELTTVSIQKKTMVQLALEKLILLVEDDQQEPIQIVLEPELIIRKTTSTRRKKSI